MSSLLYDTCVIIFSVWVLSLGLNHSVTLNESEQMFVADAKKQPLSERKAEVLCSQKWDGREVKLNFTLKPRTPIRSSDSSSYFSNSLKNLLLQSRWDECLCVIGQTSQKMPRLSPETYKNRKNWADNRRHGLYKCTTIQTWAWLFFHSKHTCYRSGLQALYVI